MKEKYCTILGVKENATLIDIKRAYRLKAKLLHPDVNKSVNAHEQFIELNEAFEYLLSYKGKRKGAVFVWTKEQNDFAKEQALKNAQMKYEEFINSDYYKTYSSINNVLNSIKYVIVIFIFSSPIIGYFSDGTTGFWWGVAIIFFGAFYWADILFHNKEKVNIREILPSIIHILKSKLFQISILILLNFILFINIGYNTLVPFIYLNVTMLCAIIIGYFSFYKANSKYKKLIYSLVIFPGVINFLLTINFIFSTNRTYELHNFEYESYNYKRRIGRTSGIILENNMYSEYSGIRFFYDYAKISGYSRIKYTFEEGLLGFKVLKDYEFYK